LGEAYIAQRKLTVEKFILEFDHEALDLQSTVESAGIESDDILDFK
jgi:hypothetical protein